MKFTFKKAVQSFLILLVLALQVNAFAEGAEPAKKEAIGGVDASLSFVSGYIWRGFDLYLAKFAQDKKEQGAFNFVPSLAPSITFTSPTLDGLSFNIWAQFPLTGRNDVTETDASGNKTTIGTGLNKADEVDYTVGYSHKSKFGTFNASYLILAFPNYNSQPSSYSELAFGFTIELVKNLSLGINHSIASPVGLFNAGETYTTLTATYNIEAGSVSIAPYLKFGYWDIPDETVNGPSGNKMVNNSIVGTSGDNFKHLDLGINATIKAGEKISVLIGLLGSYRLFTDDQKSVTDPIDNSKLYDLPALVAQFSIGVGYSF